MFLMKTMVSVMPKDRSTIDAMFILVFSYNGSFDMNIEHIVGKTFEARHVLLHSRTKHK